jgi:hypothetical protein
VRADEERIRHRWEFRAIWPDLYYNTKNSINASHDSPPVDLQFSLLTSIGERGTLSLEVDRDLPFRKTFGANPEAALHDQNYRFAFNRWSADVRSALTFGGGLWRFWGGVRAQACNRSRTYVVPGDPAGDWASEYDLLVVRTEWWRELASGSEFGMGLSYADFYEEVAYPNDTADHTEDRSDTIVSVQYRKKFNDKFTMTSSLWCDLLDRRRDYESAPSDVDRIAMSKYGLTIELPTLRGQVNAARFVLGASVFLHRFDFGGGYGQFVATF